MDIVRTTDIHRYLILICNIHNLIEPFLNVRLRTYICFFFQQAVLGFVTIVTFGLP